MLCPMQKPQVPPLRYPGFPVELGGVGELHAAFRSRKSGCAPVGMTILWVYGEWFPQQNCHPEQPTWVCQVEKEMTLQNRRGSEARRAGRQT